MKFRSNIQIWLKSNKSTKIFFSNRNIHKLIKIVLACNLPLYTHDLVVGPFMSVDTDAMEPDMVVTVGTFETSVLVLVFCGDVLALVVRAVAVDVLVVVIGIPKNIELCKKKTQKHYRLL